MADSQFTKLCECGCGQPTTLAVATSNHRGVLKGQPNRYLPGHAGRGRGRITIDKVMARCERVGDCLVWQRAVDWEGYAIGSLNGRDGRMHRLVWEYFNGPIPAGYTIDHVRARGCQHRACCNVAHMEVVTPGENVARGNSPSSLNKLKTHCPKGHPLSGTNLSKAAARQGRRACRECLRERSYAKWYQRRLNTSPRPSIRRRECSDLATKGAR